VQEQPPDAPQVTIVDPAHPARAKDLLGGVGREPWRPNRRLTLVVAAVALLLVAGGALVSQVADAWQQRQALGALRFAVQDSTAATQQDLGFGDLLVVLENDGPALVTVLDARVPLEGYPTQQVGVPVRSGKQLELVLHGMPVCGTNGPTQGPRTVVLNVAGEHGGSRELALPTAPSGFDQQALQLLQYACGLYPLDASLKALPNGSALRRGDALVVPLRLIDVSVLPLRVIGAHAGPGLGVSGPFPVGLTPRLRYPDAAHEFKGDTVEVSVRVTDCQLAKAEDLVLVVRRGQQSTNVQGPLLGVFTDRLTRLVHDRCDVEHRVHRTAHQRVQLRGPSAVRRPSGR